MLKLMSKNQNH